MRRKTALDENHKFGYPSGHLTVLQCDEKRPCSACIRHKVTCSLSTAALASSDSGPGASRGISGTALSAERNPPVGGPRRARTEGHSSFSSTTPTGTAGSPSISGQSPLLPAPQSTPPEPFPFFSKIVFPQHAERKEQTAWATDLELMHHYSTVTCFTLPRGQEVGRLWQTVVVELGLANEPLLHQILAITASHLAFLRPQQSQVYSMIASQHQSDAARGLRTGLTHITSENCHASFAAASMLVVGAWAASASPDNRSGDTTRGHQPTLEDMLDVIFLTRGMTLVLHSSEALIQRGPFGGLFVQTTNSMPYIFLEAVCGKLHELSIKVLEDHSVDQGTARIVNTEIHNLITCIKESIAWASVPALRILIFWPAAVTEDFLGLLHRKVPPALAVFTHYCVIVHESQPNTWYTSGWGLSVTKDVRKCLGEPWLAATRWPLDCMTLQHGT
ncbi:hypothetical protein AB5N19_13202 [Seiridium cardinale]